MNRIQPKALLFALVLLSCHPAWTAPREGLLGFRLDRSMELRGLVLPLRSPEGVCVGRLRVDRASVESAKVGLFRIGALPQWVLEGVQIREMEGQGHAWGAAFHALLLREPSLGAARIEDFKLLDTSGKPLVRARSGSFSKDLRKIVLKNVLIDCPERGRFFRQSMDLPIAVRESGN